MKLCELCTVALGPGISSRLCTVCCALRSLKFLVLYRLHGLGFGQALAESMNEEKGTKK